MDQWQALFDEETKREYYWNTSTNETTWIKPTLNAPTQSNPAVYHDAQEKAARQMNHYFNYDKYQDSLDNIFVNIRQGQIENRNSLCNLQKIDLQIVEKLENFNKLL